MIIVPVCQIHGARDSKYKRVTAVLLSEVVLCDFLGGRSTCVHEKERQRVNPNNSSKSRLWIIRRMYNLYLSISDTTNYDEYHEGFYYCSLYSRSTHLVHTNQYLETVTHQSILGNCYLYCCCLLCCSEFVHVVPIWEKMEWCNCSCVWGTISCRIFYCCTAGLRARYRARLLTSVMRFFTRWTV